MPQPQNLPDALQARLHLGLVNWGKRTAIWTVALGLLSTQVPFVKVILIAWIVFSLISLAGLLLGLKLARHLKVGTAASFGAAGPVNSADFQENELPEHPGDYESTHRPIPSDGEVIEIEAEVLPPEEHSKS